MGIIYITGHRNPDFDSIVSAYVYAHLKRHVDSENQYVAVRCGNLNVQTRMIFEKLNLSPPIYLKDVRTRVSDVLTKDVPRLECTNPLQTAIAALDETGLSLLPVFDTNEEYKGTISSVEVSHFLIRETIGARPSYHFRIDNLSKVLPGRIFVRGRREEFLAPIMIGAMPFERSVQSISELKDHLPIFIVGLRKNLVEYAIRNDFPSLILTGTSQKEIEESGVDFSSYEGSVYLSDVDTAETIRLLRFSTPIEEIIEKSSKILDEGDEYNDAKKILTESGLRGLPVFNNKQFTGIVSRGSFLDRPRKKLILVDHNELDQSIPGAKDAEILEIIDHHRVGSVMSQEAFSLYTKPVGCTCTIIRELYKQYGIAIPTDIAKLMLSAILSDTVLLKSPTTTVDDRNAVGALARHSGIDWQDWGKKMFSSGPRLVDMDPLDVVSGDFKTYDAGSIRFGIGQVEVQTFSGLEAVIPPLNKALTAVKEDKALEGIMLLITNITSEDSLLMLRGLDGIVESLPYETTPIGMFNLPGILSRKKQLLPEILRAIDETRRAGI